MTFKETYTLQNMDECIDTVGDAKYLTTFEPYSGYSPIKMLKKKGRKRKLYAMEGIYNEWGWKSG